MLEKQTFHYWHDLRNGCSAMKDKFAYKEFTLIAGIVVALIIMLTLWIRPVSAESSDVSKKLIPAMTEQAAKAVVKKVSITIQNSFF